MGAGEICVLSVDAGASNPDYILRSKSSSSARKCLCISGSKIYLLAHANEGPAATGLASALPGNVSYNSLICTKQFPL